MGSVVLFILISRLPLYSAGSVVDSVQVVLCEFGVIVLCFVQAKLYVSMLYACLGCTRACMCRCNGHVICI